MLSLKETPSQNVSWAERLQNVLKGCKICQIFPFPGLVLWFYQCCDMTGV